MRFKLIILIMLLLVSVSVPVSCETDIDCPLGNSCKEGICRAVCHGDNECAFNEKCLKNSCICK